MQRLVLLLALTCIYSGSSFAAPMYYTFTGQITSLGDRGGIIFDTYGTTTISELPMVEYVFLIDRAEPGSFTLSDGTSEVFRDISFGNATADYFFTDYISGSLIDGSGSTSGDNFVSELNFGVDLDFNIASDSSAIVGDSVRELVTINSFGVLFADWIINTPNVAGTTFRGIERAFTATNSASRIFSELKLTSVSAIPIPAASWLFGTALIGLLGFGKQRIAAIRR